MPAILAPYDHWRKRGSYPAKFLSGEKEVSKVPGTGYKFQR
jgi:hypothetical protein